MSIRGKRKKYKTRPDREACAYVLNSEHVGRVPGGRISITD